VIAKRGDFLLGERLIRVLVEIDGFGLLRQYPCRTIRGPPSTPAAPAPAATLAIGLSLRLLVRGLAIGRPRASPSWPAPSRAPAIRRFRPFRRIHSSMLPNRTHENAAPVRHSEPCIRPASPPPTSGRPNAQYRASRMRPSSDVANPGTTARSVFTSLRRRAPDWPIEGAGSNAYPEPAENRIGSEFNTGAGQSPNQSTTGGTCRAYPSVEQIPGRSDPGCSGFLHGARAGAGRGYLEVIRCGAGERGRGRRR
jgi:hypothetical protein